MSALQVLFEVPNAIRIGLESGLLERVGGVIRDTGSKQVVMWLRDSGIVEQGAGKLMEFAGSAMNPLNAVLSIAQTATTLVDGHLTRSAIHVIGDQVATLTSMTVTGNVINLAFSAMTLRKIINRIDNLSEQLNQLTLQMNAQFEHDREIAFRTALESARDTLETMNEGARIQSSRSAVDGLFAAQQSFMIEFENSFQKIPQDERYLELAQHQLLQAAYALTSRIQCYAQIGETKMAIERMQEGMAEIRRRAERLIQKWLTEEPSLYLHHWVESQTVAQFFSVKAWLRGERIDGRDNKVDVLFAILDELRGQFWNEGIDFERQRSPLGVLDRLRPVNKDELIGRRLKGLHNSFALIENVERLEGYVDELRSLRLSMDEWSNLVDKEQLEKHGGALIVDVDALHDIEARLSA